MKKNRWRTQLHSDAIREIPLKIQIKSTGLAFKVDKLYNLNKDMHVNMYTSDENTKPSRKEIYETIVFGSRAMMSIDYLFHQGHKKLSERRVLHVLKKNSTKTLDLRLFQTFLSIQNSLDNNIPLTKFQKVILKEFLKL